MRDNDDYAFDEVEGIRAHVAANPWCTFVSAVPGRGLVGSHYPVLLDDEADGLALLSHVGRPDEIKLELGRHEVMAIIEGPNGYVSPSWYGSSPAVPTWNFAVVHLHGTPEILSGEENLEVLERLVDHFELPLPHPFVMRQTLENSEYAERIATGTVGFRLRVERFEAKNKMSQDKPDAVFERVVKALNEPGPYRNPRLADHMKRTRTDTAAPLRDR